MYRLLTDTVNKIPSKNDPSFLCLYFYLFGFKMLDWARNYNID
ncbi:hypothetical protein BTN49_3072 [Candidatus Enterovibrio escicola]|uniref:Uncharacterized protein n=1 Tax=Candidatus Enterovibrio escicola TaxID=1927127 RepID=A0A2A5T048_9GAMM|nr:hypothetical protein BTN49_3072 [Candidatus Enterovibrio escacola]